MSEIWSAPCRECDMEGIVTDMEKATNRIPGECLYKTCPTCKGAREVALMVACEIKEATLFSDEHPFTGGCRSLTVSEVEMIFDPANINPIRDKYPQDEDIWQAIYAGEITFKGQPVKVKPCVIK